jgi:hypothetical protein
MLLSKVFPIYSSKIGASNIDISMKPAKAQKMVIQRKSD